MTAGATSGRATTGRRPRHVHSPRVRRAAAQHHLDLTDLDRITGTGRNGRVRVDDVLRAAEAPPPQPSPASAATGGGAVAGAIATALVEVDVSRIPADRLLPAVVHATVDAARSEAPDLVSRGVLVVRGGEAHPLPDAADLTAEGVQRRLATEDRHDGEQPRLAVVDVGARGVLLDTAPPPGGTVAAVGVGAPADRPAVVRDADGLPSIAVRSIAYLTITYDPAAVTPEAAGRLLSGTARSLVTV